MKYNWNRPKLPENLKGEGQSLGVLLLVGATATTIWGLQATDGLLFVVVGSALFGLALLTITVSFILREIRQLAFEAAIRAGEAKPIK